MRTLSRTIPLAVLAVAFSLLAGGCGDTSSRSEAAAKRSCPASLRAGWQSVANRIHAPVYCPAWMPDPLKAQIGNEYNTVNSVDARDRSYLIGWDWQETGTGEIHVNLRAYAGRTAIPTCDDTITGAGPVHHRQIPCFADRTKDVRRGGITAAVYTANQGADQWHVLYAWRRKGSLYTLSEHVAPPLTYKQIRANLNRMLRSLVLVRPS
jgi:hypothetical protein